MSDSAGKAPREPVCGSGILPVIRPAASRQEAAASTWQDLPLRERAGRGGGLIWHPHPLGPGKKVKRKCWLRLGYHLTISK